MRVRDWLLIQFLGRVVPWVLQFYFRGKPVAVLRSTNITGHDDCTFRGIGLRVRVSGNTLVLKCASAADPLDTMEVPLAALAHDKRYDAWIWRQD